MFRAQKPVRSGDLSYNLGQNKWKTQTQTQTTPPPPPPPPNQGWENGVVFCPSRSFILDLGGMGVFCSILFCPRLQISVGTGNGFSIFCLRNCLRPQIDSTKSYLSISVNDEFYYCTINAMIFFSILLLLSLFLTLFRFIQLDVLRDGTSIARL